MPASLTKLSHRTFAAGTIVTLDGMYFDHCTFENDCVIRYAGGMVGFGEGNRIGSPRFEFLGPAAATVELIKAMGQFQLDKAALRNYLGL